MNPAIPPIPPEPPKRPPEPDKSKLPRLHAAWSKLFGPHHREPFFIPDGTTPSPIGHSALGQFGTSVSRWEKSLNWSGSYVVPSDSQTVTIIFGEWRIPEVSLPQDYDRDLRPGTYAISTWIGIDGNRRYLNASLPQIGSLQKIKIDAAGNRIFKTFLFQQWWRRDDPCSKWRLIKSIPVAPGNLIRCAIWVDSPRSANFYVAVRDHSYSRHDIVPSVDELPTPTVTGATAEWIMERPTIIGSTQPYEFPHYEETAFKSCIVGVGRAIPDYDRELDLTNARYIRMYERRRWPSRTAEVSVPKRANADHESFAMIRSGFTSP